MDHVFVLMQFKKIKRHRYKIYEWYQMKKKNGNRKFRNTQCNEFEL